ncbi:acyltransferase family protein [Uruburuella testudinis]|uniref:Acyltransferase family protein n=1 Tax=Uruburuella testudinis TaxID=1282863 RepID=A0ABY4DSP8_9NEIS|nr:acyltransferase family protein [Uruburuella testudinis]UOO82067.1 acyltransferase family protein [Uruburuella testudinis]
MNTDNNRTYYYGLDQLRSVLMLIGVLIHSVAVIGPYPWAYNSKLYQNDGLFQVIYVTHFFRMEAFFLIAGFFSCLVLYRKDRSYFMQGRIRRVLVPLLASVALINTFEVYFVVSHGITPWADIGLGNFIVHSWFLLTLMLISLMCLLPIDKMMARFLAWKWPLKLAFFVFYALLPFGLKFVLNRIIPMDGYPLFYEVYGYVVEKTLYYSIYFFIGYWLYADENARARVQSKPVMMAAGLAAAAGLAYLTARIGVDRESASMLARVGNVMIQHITAIAVSCLLFAFFVKAHFRFSKTTAFLVNSAIVIYLFHHPLVIVLAYYLDVPGLNSTVYFLLVSSITYILSFGIYLLVRSNRVTARMFGLK